MSTAETLPPTLAQELARHLGGDRLLLDEPARRFFSQDIAGAGAYVAAAVARPGSPECLAAVVRAATGAGYAVIPRGGGASYTAGYVPPHDRCVLVDTGDLSRVVELNTEDMYVTVEAGCTWQELLAALAPHRLRTPFWGPLSGATATVGGSLSQNAILWGSARYGVSAESVLALDVVLGDGSLLATGSAAQLGARPFFRYYGPDLTGLFLGDAGALGIKARATLRLIRRPEWALTASFGFDAHEAMATTMAAVAREGLVSECFAMDPVLTAQRLKRAGLAGDLEAVRGVVRSSRSVGAGLREAARMALAGRSFLDDAPYSMHVGTEGRSEHSVRESLDAVRSIAAAHGGREVENTVPKVLRGQPFVPMSSAIGPSGERWLPVHGLVPLSDAAAAWTAVRALFDDRRAELDRHGIRIGVLTAIVAPGAFVLEPVFYWPAPRTPYYERVLDEATRARLTDFPPNPAGEALVFELRAALTRLFLGRGAAHLQIGRTYRYREGLRPESARLLDAVKHAADPRGLLNPGALGFPGTGSP